MHKTADAASQSTDKITHQLKSSSVCKLTKLGSKDVQFSVEAAMFPVISVLKKAGNQIETDFKKRLFYHARQGINLQYFLYSRHIFNLKADGAAVAVVTPGVCKLK